MENEGRQKTIEEIDAEIKALLETRKNLKPLSSYDTRPLRSKLAYDLQPVKLFTSFLKTALIALVVVGLVFGYGYWKGKKGKPVQVDMKDFQAKVTCKYTNKEHDLAAKNGHLLFDGKPITESDIPKLKPYGIELQPKLFAGIGTAGPAIGGGLEIAHFYKLNLDVFAMSDKAIYTGVSYDLKVDTEKAKINWFENSNIGIGVGKGLDKNDTRAIMYWSIRF